MTIRTNLSIRSDKLSVHIDDDIIREWIRSRMNASVRLFRQKMRKPAPSASGDYPSNVRGVMSAGIRGPFLYGRVGRVDQTRYNIQGADVVPFHLYGTRKMAPRKLVGDALKEVLRANPQKKKLASAAKFSVRRVS